MTTSWNETQQIEAVITGEASPGEALLFEARLLIDNEFAEKIIWQRKTYHIVKQYGRMKLMAEIETVHQQLFTQPQHIGFSQKDKTAFQ